MQKTITSFLFLFYFSAASCQKTLIGFSLGSNIIPIEKTAFGTNYQLGPFTGIKIQHKLTDRFCLSSGLFFSQRKKMYLTRDTSSVLDSFEGLFNALGASAIDLETLLGDLPFADLNVYNVTTGIATENYLEVPLLASFYHENLFLSAGPYVGFLMNGRKREETRSTAPLLQVLDLSSIDSTGLLSLFLPPADETTYDEYASIAQLRRLDIGAVFSLGYSINNVEFNLSYTLGFNDYRADSGGDPKNTHKAIRIAICYYFGSSLDSGGSSSF
jgi:hypothetical protein